MTPTIRHATRRLAGNSRSSLLAGVVLALGIGTGTAMFALLDVALLERLPYPEPDELVQVWATDQQIGVFEGGISMEEYRDIARMVRSAENVAYSSTWLPTLATDERRRQIQVARTSSNLFETLGVAPAVGSTFSDRAIPHVVLSHRLHEQLFGAARELPETAIVLDGVPYVVVGIMPPGFSYPADAEAWVPAAVRPPTSAPARDGAVIGRLRPEIELANLEAELGSIARSMPETHPDWTSGRGLRAVPLQEQVTAQVKNIVLLLVGAVGLFFLISCASAAQLLFVENLGRRSDFAVRAALGAPRGVLRGQLFVEAALVALVATAGGALLAGFLVDAGRRFMPPDLPRLAALRISPSVLLVMLILGALAALTVGLLSGWRLTRGEVVAGLVGGLGEGKARTAPVRAILAAGGTAGIILLTFGAAALVLEMWRVTHADLGFDPEGVYSAKMCIPEDVPDAPATDLELAYHEAGRELAAERSIRTVAIADGLPLGSYTTAETFIEGVEGYPEVRVRAVSSKYFDALSIPLIEGRPFSADAGKGQKVAIVNRAFGDRYWPGRSALGEQLMGSWDDDREWITIVGVAGNVRRGAGDDFEASEVYIPFFQQESDCGSLIVATGRDGSGSVVRDLLWNLDGRQSVSGVIGLESRLADQNWRPRLRAAVLGLFGVLALVFGAVALYATLRQVVASRKKELAMRAALGATPRDLARSVLGGHALPVALGIVLGGIASVLAVRVVGAAYHGIETVDGSAFAIVCGLLATSALMAAAGPAIRSGRIDVMEALREE